MFFCVLLYRKNPHSDEQDNIQETEKGQSSEQSSVLRSASEAQDIIEFTPASSQTSSCSSETAEVERLSRQQSSPSSPPTPRSVSPSRYMRRLPPPPGFYLPKEHSYAQLCPLLWRRRYDQAIDCLEKALRQLHAARRRESRLRNTVLRLRDKQLKHTLLLSRDGCKSATRCRGGFNQDSGNDGKCEDTMSLEDRCAEQVDHFLPVSNSWAEEKGYCFYCGRGQVLGSNPPTHTVSQTKNDHTDSVKAQCSVNNRTDECSRDIVRLEKLPGDIVETSVATLTNSQVLLQTQSLQHVVTAAVSPPDAHEPNVPFLGCRQELLLSDACEVQSKAPGQEHHQDLQQQLFWIQGDTEAQVILVPAEEGLQRYLKTEGIADDTQTILVSEVDLKQDLSLMTVSRDGAPPCCHNHGNEPSVINSATVEMREDVREKLKEHLEGFHLQLSTEFQN